MPGLEVAPCAVPEFIDHDDLLSDHKAPPGYRVLGRLGQGAFGEVSRAVSLATGEEVALKHVFPQRAARGCAPAPCNLARELAALQALRHPNVVALRAVLPQGSGRTLVLELCEGDLGDLLRHAPARLDEALAKTLARQLLRGVAHMHGAGFMHRDLKPGNILLARDGALKLADFGLARRNDCPGRAAYSHAVATRWYRAPELLFGARCYGPAVDVWAAGCIIAELLGLDPLFAGDTDIDQLGRIIARLGSVDEACWPGVRALPDYGKLRFAPSPAVPLAAALPDAPAPALDLLGHMLRWNPDERVSAEAALHHEWFLLEPATAPHAVVAEAVAAMQRLRDERRAAQRAEEAAWQEIYGC
ncbi:hypothetical protein WJX81_000855 [Elliptochloris bilobata]|uniref:cyclin-dependent kinase n=1 Tax=Elliptochloris bilobata TaxID=381761 RepID=A0AAW1QWL2_9CHLO